MSPISNIILLANIVFIPMNQDVLCKAFSGLPVRLSPSSIGKTDEMRKPKKHFTAVVYIDIQKIFFIIDYMDSPRCSTILDACYI
jgi:hypothetical protein